MKLLILLIALCVIGTSCASPFFQQTNLTHNSKGRIIGGTDARAGEFKFAAALYISQSNQNTFCGGALLNEQWIITAAHCVNDSKLIRLQLGSNKLNGIDGNRRIFSTDNFVLHPDFNPQTSENDLALVKLRLPITFTEYIEPVTYLPVAELPVFSTCSILGWGQTSDDVPGESNMLQTVRVTALTNEECSLTYGNQITDSMVCVDGNLNEGTCIGDSGSPMVQKLAMGYTVLVGVSSFYSGNGCESSDPSGFTRIFGAKQWITSVTGKQ